MSRIQELSNRINTVIEKANFHVLVKDLAVKHDSYYNQIDDAFDADNDALVDELMNKQTEIVSEIKATIQSKLPEQINDLALRTYAFTAMDLALKL